MILSESPRLKMTGFAVLVKADLRLSAFICG